MGRLRFQAIRVSHWTTWDWSQCPTNRNALTFGTSSSSPPQWGDYDLELTPSIILAVDETTLQYIVKNILIDNAFFVHILEAPSLNYLGFSYTSDIKVFQPCDEDKTNLRFARSNRLTNRQSLRSLASTWICRTWLYNLVKQDGQLQKYTTSHHTLKSTLCVTGRQLQICIGGIQNHELPLYPTYLIRLQQYVLLIYTLQGHLVAWRSHQPEP